MKDVILRKVSTSKQSGLKRVLLKCSTFVFLMLLATFAVAQTISGTITDENNEPVIGANIIVDGTSVGTTTDIDGKFTLKVPKGENTIKVAYIGMKEQLINIDGRSRIDVKMESDTELIDEVVVIGYGVQKRSDLTGSISSIKSKDIKSLVSGSASAVLQGKMAGVQIENFGGKPGGQTNVFIRGVSSFTNSYPLYVIDGTFADNMNFLNTSDIQSIEVLKDAASSAIYGSRAANGVVIITTKYGESSNKANVSIGLKTGFETPSKLLDLMNASEFVAFRNQLEANDGTGISINESDFPATNWQELSLTNGAINSAGLSVSGGTDNATYYISGSYFNQDGILVGSGFNALNGRVNSRFKLGRLTISQSLSLQESNLEENRWFGYDGSTAPILAENKPENEGGFEAAEASVHGFGGSNKYAQAAIEDNNSNAFNLFGNVNFQFDITEDFNVKLNFGADKINRLSSIFVPTYFMSSTDAVFNTNPKNSLINLNDNYLLTLMEPTLNYSTTFGDDNNLSAVVGYTRQKVTDANNGVWVRNTPANSIAVVGAAPANEVAGLSGFEDISGLESLFGRINYSHNNRYLLQATLRRDASSKFPEENRVGIFPSISAGWNLHNESFFSTDGIISRLKLRAGYGTLGSENVGAYAYTPLIGLNSGVSFNDASQVGFSQTTFVDDNLKWEVARTTNIGADLGLLDNQILLSAEYYIKDSQDVLAGVNVPSTSGTSNSIVRNAASIRNNGFELEALYRNSGSQAFNWELSANFGTYNSEVYELPNPLLGPAVTEDLTAVNRFIVGETPGVFWGFETVGVYADQAAIDSDPNIANDEVRKGLVQPGDLIRVDQNGDGIVNDEDNLILGDPTPDFTYGFNFTGGLNALDFGIFLNGVQGNEIYNMPKFFNTVWADGNKLKMMNDAWTPSNTNTDVPRATATDAGGNRAPSDFFVEDGSYLRLRTLELGYTLGNGSIADWLGDVRISLTAQNLLTLTGYSGYDPDVSSAAGDRSSFGFGSPVATVNPLLSRGIDVRAYPNTRTIMFGVQANF